MNIEELCDTKPESVSTDLSWLRNENYNHVPELHSCDVCELTLPKGHEVIEINVYKDHDLGDGKSWQLGVVTLNSRPAMVLQHAGIDGDEYSNRIILDIPDYMRLVNVLKNAAQTEWTVGGKENSRTEDMPDLTKFNGHSLGELSS